MSQTGKADPAAAVELSLRRLAVVLAHAAGAAEPAGVAGAFAEAHRVTTEGLRSAVALGRKSGLSWRYLARLLDIPVSTLHRNYGDDAPARTPRDPAPAPAARREQPAATAGPGTTAHPLTGTEPEPALLGGRSHVAANQAALLTGREYQVAVEVSRGKTNAQIARALSVSERTVGSHLASIRAKLLLRNRVEVALWASSNSPG
ncbi:response regulator transcription factor [Actinoplanes sp. NPDC049265]|uniref:helix-turn-helix transcriptional regulator n=1 Tax=Actinoplanes sp. NPDC049265 TaxID=3363902 RepID=UPI00371031F8